MLSGPMFERSGDMFKSTKQKEGAHYNTYKIVGGVDAIKQIFPDGCADEMNFCLFSTSGIHGSYSTIEDAEEDLINGDDASITVLIIQPRLVCLRYGDIEVTESDLPYLKKLRQSSWNAISNIGKP